MSTQMNESEKRILDGEGSPSPAEYDNQGLGELFEPSPETVANLLRPVLKELGVDLEAEQTKDTPMRWAKVLWEFRPKTGEVPNMKSFPNEGYTGAVYDRVRIDSFCSHHMLPVHGTAHIAYLPAAKVLGLSKLSRIADFFARQPVMQEELTETIARYLEEHIEPKGVAVFIEASHSCKSMRGVQKDGLMCTTVLKGAFLEDDKARQEFQFNCNRRQSQ